MVLGKFGKCISPDCDALGSELMEAYGALAYASARAVQNYTGDTRRFVGRALEHLRKTGIDKEDLESITDPLKEITEAKVPASMSGVGMASRIDSAQEEMLRWTPNFIAACECSKRKLKRD